METSYKLTFYSIIGIIVMGLIAKLLESIDLTTITFWEGVQTVFVASALFVAFEMIINRKKQNNGNL